MASKIELCNMALANIGHRSFIQDISEQSVEARYARIFYETVRQETLRMHPWNFATVRAQLAIVGPNAAPQPWLYQYARPTACIEARYIDPFMPGTDIPFEAALAPDASTQVILTNMPDAVLVYTADVTDTTRFDALFTSAFAWNLGSYLSRPVTGSSADKQAAKTEAMNYIRLAQAVDAREGKPEPSNAPDWIETRLGGGSLLVTDRGPL